MQCEGGLTLMFHSLAGFVMLHGHAMQVMLQPRVLGFSIPITTHCVECSLMDFEVSEDSQGKGAPGV